MKNAKLMVSMMANRIYLGTTKKNDPQIMNDSKIDFTNEALCAVAEHMAENAKRGKNKILFEGIGRLIWEPIVKHTNDPDETCFCEKCIRADRGGI